MKYILGCYEIGNMLILVSIFIKYRKLTFFQLYTLWLKYLISSEHIVP